MQVSYTERREVWLPTLTTRVSMLTTLAVVSTTLECSMENLTITACSSTLQSSCISTPLLTNTVTYLSRLSPCTSYTLSITHTSHTLWAVTDQTKVSLELDVKLGRDTATISTFYKSPCIISSSLWSVSLCPMNLDKSQECRHYSVHPDMMNTKAMVDNLIPCTQYVIR